MFFLPHYSVFEPFYYFDIIYYIIIRIRYIIIRIRIKIGIEVNKPYLRLDFGIILRNSFLLAIAFLIFGLLYIAFFFAITLLIIGL